MIVWSRIIVEDGDGEWVFWQNNNYLICLYLFFKE